MLLAKYTVYTPVNQKSNVLKRGKTKDHKLIKLEFNARKETGFELERQRKKERKRGGE